MLSFFSIETTAFTVLDYPMSWLELIGTLFNLWCVWLAVKKHIWTWPVGLVGIICYIALFYQIQLYSDLVEQLYFFVMTFVGWYAWAKRPPHEEAFVRTLTSRQRVLWGVVTVAGTLVLAYLTSHFSVWFPTIFPEAASYPWLDAATTVMSFVATYLMAKRYLECWPLWITVDVIGIGLYYVKGVKFISLEYVLFLIMAIIGAREWYKLRSHSSLKIL